MYGEDFDWENYFILWRFLFLVLSLLLFLLYPVVVVADLFRESDILFVPPSKASKDENRFFSLFRKNMHRPFNRAMTRFFIHIFFILNVILSLIDPLDEGEGGDWSFYDVITPLFFTSFFIDHIIELVKQRWKFLASFWNLYCLSYEFLFVVGFGLRGHGFYMLRQENNNDNRAALPANHITNIGSTLYGIAAAMAIMEFMRWLIYIRSVGPMIISIIKMIKDMVIFTLIFVIILVGFGFGLYFNYHIYEEDSNSNSPTALYNYTGPLSRASTSINALFWAIMDPGEGDDGGTAFVPKNGTNDEQSYEFSHFMGIVMWAVYQVVVTIMLVNMLIAMMNTTYVSIFQDADVQWKYIKSFFRLEYLSARAILPPPFRIFFYLAKALHHKKKKNRPKSQGTDERNQARSEYYRLLWELVKRKQNYDREASSDNDFDDLRQDIKNMIDKMGNQVHQQVSTLLTRLDQLEKENEQLKKEKRSDYDGLT